MTGVRERGALDCVGTAMVADRRERTMKTDNRAAAIAGVGGGLLVSVVAGTDYAMNQRLVEEHETLVNWAQAVIRGRQAALHGRDVPPTRAP
jgi:hypothetical protein